jgi:hypothetical protein
MCCCVFHFHALTTNLCVCFMLAQDGDTSGSDSPYEPEEENIRSRKAKGKEATNSRTTNRPTIRPPQLRIKEEVTDNQDAF